MIKKISDSPPDYKSDDPKKDFDKFRDVLKQIVSAPQVPLSEVKVQDGNDGSARSKAEK